MTSAPLNAIETEREELDWILACGALGRSTNLTRMLGFICERHFEARGDEITEYRVAVEALGRRSDFDPHTDTIVRVTTHLLRKRLQEIYQGEGANRPVRIVIPAGKYAPSFVPNEAYVEPQPTVPQAVAEPKMAAASAAIPPDTGQTNAKSAASAEHGTGWAALYALLGIVVAVGLGFFALRRMEHYPAMGSIPKTRRVALPTPQGTVRALLGNGRKTYVDSSGNTWKPGTGCKGGTNISLPSQRIIGTLDPEIYLGGVRGITHCTFAAEPGLYEVHLHFAETSDLEPAQRKAMVIISAQSDAEIDVVNAAGGTGIAVSRVFTGVRPQTDGMIHIDYTSEVSLLNAVEILPAPTGKQLPVRLVTADSPYIDKDKQVWGADRYFIGGRRGLVWEAAKRAELGAYFEDRIGKMRYLIPVVPGQKYRVKLYFREPWFGRANGGSSGVGKRVFNVSLNGSRVLTDFDISANGNKDGIVETFESVEGSSDGQIQIDFLPVMNYPLLNAIEVVPEVSSPA